MNVDVLIITAIKEEYDGVRAVNRAALRDSKWIEKRVGTQKFFVSERSFEGAHGQLQIVVAQAGAMGGAAVTSCIGELVSHFYKPRCLAMTGVCAGRPGSTELGDVIAASLAWQFDEGKIKEQGTILPRGEHRTLPEFRRRELERYTPPLEVMKQFQRPWPLAPQLNWLLLRLLEDNKVPTEHPDRQTLCPDWKETLELGRREKLISTKGAVCLTKKGKTCANQLRHEYPDGLPKLACPAWRVIIGGMGSSNALQKHESIWGMLQKQYESVIALEMEAAALATETGRLQIPHWLVMKGVMDQANIHKNDRFKPFAARASAECLIDFLRHHLEPSHDTELSSENHGEINDGWQRQHLQDISATAGPRYCPDLQVNTPLHNVFEALCDTPLWTSSVIIHARKLRKLSKDWSTAVQTKERGGWAEPFPNTLIEKGLQLAASLDTIIKALEAIIQRKTDASGCTILEMVAKVQPQAREMYAELRHDLEQRHGRGTADNASFRQFQAEYNVSFPTANVDAAKEIITRLDEIDAWGKLGGLRAYGARGVLLTGAAGTGKTHGICDIARDRLRRGLYTLVLFGEHFTSASEPWEWIRQILGFGPMTRDELLALLDRAGEKSSGHLLLCIDGMNESRPREYWRDRLPSLVTQVARFPHIKLCVSCRSTYERIVVPEHLKLERIEHRGFEDVQYTAVHSFFTYYNLEPPITPILNPEFSNPLFLRLTCETLKASNAKRMPASWHGFATVFSAFMREKNRAFALEFARDERDRIPERGMQEFIHAAEQNQRVYLEWGEADKILHHVYPHGGIGPSLLTWLVREGLLTTDMGPEGQALGGGDEEIVRIAFERLGEHLLAARLLGKLTPETLTGAIESGALSFAFSSEHSIAANRGLIEALSIQIPEHPNFARELVDILPASVPRSSILEAIISALPWRDPEHITCQTQPIAIEALTTERLAYKTFDNLLLIATQETSVDALWLHCWLVQQTMPRRDAFLCGYLHDRIDKPSAVERLLRAPFEVKTKQLPEPILRRWATLLLWFCSAADRRVRDRATKGLVAITEARPTIWVALIEQFCSVDDEYVVERCLCAAYGTLLRTRDVDAERDAAEVAYLAIFAESTRFQNVIIRDYAKSIIELAVFDKVLSEVIQLDRVRPPYQSEWPLVVPTQEELEHFKNETQDYPKLYWSCLQDDFAQYTLLRLDKYKRAHSRDEMGRWILNHVVEDMSYGGQGLTSYDQYMMYKFGGGRGRPGWAERIGKKYQWIAFNRLAARLADHVSPERDRWDEAESVNSLILETARDIDPSILAPPTQSQKAYSSWWQPQRYDFEAFSGQSDKEWAAVSDDIPSSEQMLQPLIRDGNRQWQILEGHPRWSARTDDEDEWKPYRDMWMQIRGYLVKQKSAERMFQWLQTQHFMGRWMVQGAEYHSGFVGEYPWGVLFNKYPEEWQSPGRGYKYPDQIMSVCSYLSPEYSDDSFQAQNLRICAPSHIFFQQDQQLRWDGLGGYVNAEGRLQFFDPSLNELGHPALLVDREFLLEYLRENRFCLLWTVLGEKTIISGLSGGEVPRLEFSRAHMLNHDGYLRSSNPIIKPWIPQSERNKGRRMRKG